MEEVLLQLARLAVPILALMIPIIALTAHYVVQPLVGALSRLIESKERSAAVGAAGQDVVSARDLAALEQRLASVERALGRVLEEQEFQRELQRGAPRPAVRAGEVGERE